MATPDGRFVLVHNGKAYGFDPIRDELARDHAGYRVLLERDSNPGRRLSAVDLRNTLYFKGLLGAEPLLNLCISDVETGRELFGLR